LVLTLQFFTASTLVQVYIPRFYLCLITLDCKPNLA
jgi:hypothetical protein